MFVRLSNSVDSLRFAELCSAFLSRKREGYLHGPSRVSIRRTGDDGASADSLERNGRLLGVVDYERKVVNKVFSGISLAQV